MVYRGPSQGCKACRKRHMKCDRAHPSCDNCVKAEQECPGYRDFFEVMWKDQNEVVPEKARRQRVARTRKKRERAIECSASHSVAEVSSVSRSVSRSISPQLLPNTESECLSFFFNNYVDVTADPEAQIGYLELLLPLRPKGPADSLLSLATSALAANITFASFGRSLDSELPSTLFSKALALTQCAINDPSQNATDETLVTVLLLGACDILCRTARSQRPSGIHKNGALALVKHRGALNFETELSKRLLIAVRHHTIRMALWTGEQIPADPTVWGDVGTMPESSATILDTYAADLANLNVRMQDLNLFPSVPSPNQGSTNGRSTPPVRHAGTQVEKYHSVLTAAKSLEARLANWPKSIPPSWQPIRVSSLSCIDPKITAVGLYGASCDIYPSINVAGLWNWYRTLRINTVKIVMICQQALTQRGKARDMTTQFTETAQMLVDEFCASIPFHLGNRIGPMLSHELGKVIYPHLPLATASSIEEARCATATSTAEHKRAAACSGAWFILDPLSEILKATFLSLPSSNGEAENKPLIALRKGQREWLMGQMMRVQNMNLYGQARSPTGSSKSPSISLSMNSTPASSSSSSPPSPAALKMQWPSRTSWGHQARTFPPTAHAVPILEQ